MINIKFIMYCITITPMYFLAMTNDIFSLVPSQSNDNFNIVKTLYTTAHKEIIYEIKNHCYFDLEPFIKRYFSFLDPSKTEHNCMTKPVINPLGTKFFLPHTSALYSTLGQLLKKKDDSFECAIFDQAGTSLAACNHNYFIIFDLTKDRTVFKKSYSSQRPESIHWSNNKLIVAIQNNFNISIFYVGLSESWMINFFILLKQLSLYFSPHTIYNSQK